MDFEYEKKKKLFKFVTLKMCLYIAYFAETKKLLLKIL